ncbi:hypothetical protein Gpo141_00007540 [Globisporangium polare]
MQLRMRNQFVVSARSSSGGKRRHAVALYVHIREQDVDHFNSTAAHQETKGEDAASGINYIEHVLELLDADSDFETLVRELDAMRTAEELMKNSKSAFAMKTIASSLVQVQWRALDQSHRGLANVLQVTHRPRKECFSRKEATVAQSSKTQQATGDEEVYAGGMYVPVPMRKLAVEAWLYPPHVAIPATGDRIPENSRSVTDFFHADDAAQ